MSDHQPIPAPVTKVTSYTVTLLPEAHPDFALFSISVERERGTQQWKIRASDRVLDADGVWQHGGPCRCRRPHAARLFTHDEAITRAEAAAPDVTFNGRTAADTYRQSRESHQ